MKSILIEKPNQLAIIEREIPTPSAGEVRVKVKLAGICGSDSHIYRGHNPFAKYPRVIGHEFGLTKKSVRSAVKSAVQLWSRLTGCSLWRKEKPDWQMM
ncbi:dehydrogenase [Escherichia coli]|nr:dehydrogenase [Escherichia coli]